MKTFAIPGLVALIWAGLAAAQAGGPRRYEVVTRTGMPHLEENLRYAVRREERCLDPADLSGAFWMLDHESLQGCRLEPAGPARYALACEGNRDTTGEARWQLDGPQLTGTLDVRLGGKNMTFYQRVTARPLGGC